MANYPCRPTLCFNHACRDEPPRGNTYEVGGSPYYPPSCLVGRTSAPPSAAERLKHAQAERNKMRVDTESRRCVVSLAVRASDGNWKDVAALAVLFAELTRADDELRALDGLVERLAAEAKAAGERHG